jgi:Protein of unknown function (DUF2911)
MENRCKKVMHVCFACIALATWLMLASSVGTATQEDPQHNPVTTVCTFDDGKQISVRYNPENVKNRKLPNGEVWAPGGSPMFLFTQSELTVGTSELPLGAYSMYMIPAERQWTLVVNRKVDGDSKYDHQQDVLRAPMEVGTLSQQAKQVQMVFGHIAPQRCSLRLYRGGTGAWVEFNEK